VNQLKALFVGVAKDPLVVGAFRALVLYVLPIGAAAGIAYAQEWTDPRLVPLVPLLVALIRALESAIDRSLKPDQNAVNPPPVAGGGADELRPVPPDAGTP
jgi:hypothetical protein